MELQKVKLIKHGAGGVELSYIKSSVKSGFVFNDAYKTGFKAHASISLKKAMRSLGEHVMLICRLNNATEAKKAVYVTGVQSDACTAFTISAEIETFDGLRFPIKTPLMTDGTEYKGFDNAIEIINNIYKEAEEYVIEEKGMSDKELVANYAKEEVDLEALSPDELTVQARIIMENSGAIVIEQGDMEEEVVEAKVKEDGDPFLPAALPKEVEAAFKEEAASKEEVVDIGFEEKKEDVSTFDGNVVIPARQQV